jgi:integrase
MKRRWTSELADFQRFCAVERQLAPTTCSAYERDVSACLGYLQGEGIRDLGEVKVTHLRAFLAAEQVRRPAVSSQARSTAALKCFVRFLVEEERILRDPALPLRTPKKREVLPDTLTMGELERLLVQPGRTDLGPSLPGQGRADRLLLALLAYGGLRRSELLGLDRDDVDLSRRLLRVRKAADDPDQPCARPALCRVLRDARAAVRAGGLRRRAGQPAPLHPARAGLPPPRRRERRQRAQACDPAHAPPRLRLRAPARRREPAPDPGAARAQAPRLDAAR